MPVYEPMSRRAITRFADVGGVLTVAGLLLRPVADATLLLRPVADATLTRPSEKEGTGWWAASPRPATPCARLSPRAGC